MFENIIVPSELTNSIISPSLIGCDSYLLLILNMLEFSFLHNPEFLRTNLLF